MMNIDHSPQHIIVIDDEQEMLNIYRGILTHLGHRVETAHHPAEGLSKIRMQEARQDPFTVAVIDMIFEGVGEMGKKITQQIKERHPYMGTVISTSLNHSPQNVLQLRDESGVDQFIQKKDVDMDRAYIFDAAIQSAAARVKYQVDNAQIPYKPGTFPEQLHAPDKILAEPIFGAPRKTSIFHCDVFMIMPFADELMTIYERAIVPAATSHDLVIKRGDSFFSDKPIMDEVWSAIYACKFVIADCTGKNANVFYELGMAHTLGKPAIPITQIRSDIPFDIRSRRYILYSPDDLIELRTNLENAIDSLVINMGL
ncbi:MAG: response regulator [Chloroflexota bacterium]